MDSELLSLLYTLDVLKHIANFNNHQSAILEISNIREAIISASHGYVNKDINRINTCLHQVDSSFLVFNIKPDLQVYIDCLPTDVLQTHFKQNYEKQKNIHVIKSNCVAYITHLIYLLEKN
jgi:hypothetical protein